MGENRNFGTFLILLVVFLVLIGNSVTIAAPASLVDQSLTSSSVGFKDPDEQLFGSRSRFLVTPSNFIRYLFYNARPSERQAINGLPIGYKRSSSALDALTGVTLGKRGTGMELLNIEPYFGRQLGPRSLPRMYDLQWAPLEAYDAPAAPN